jgi:hypothetical protein
MLDYSESDDFSSIYSVSFITLFKVSKCLFIAYSSSSLRFSKETSDYVPTTDDYLEFLASNGILMQAEV